MGSVLSLIDPSSGRSDTETSYKETDYINNCPKGTGEKIMAVPDHLSLPENCIPFPLAPWTLTIVKRTYLYPKIQINTI